MIASNLKVKVKVLSDLHIGSGKTLVRSLDWLPRNDSYIYFANPNRIGDLLLERALADGKDDVETINLITGLGLDDLESGGWFEPDDFKTPSDLFAYRMQGNPATKDIREAIKDVEGKPYLPGSSLKGALRTVLAVAAAAELKPKVDADELDRRRSWAAQQVEKQLFGRNPNYDLLRLLQVSDSKAIDSSHLRLRRVHIYPTASQSSRGRSRGLDIDLETVAKGSEFELSIHIPLELIQGKGDFEKRRAAELSDWAAHIQWLERLARHGRLYARQLLIEEVTYFQDRTDVPLVHKFYNGLVDQFSKLAKNQFLLPIGWGGGWHTKTLNQYLREDNRNFEEIVKKYRLDPTGIRKTSQPFPKSRHLIRQPNGDAGAPLGWCLVELNES